MSLLSTSLQHITSKCLISLSSLFNDISSSTLPPLPIPQQLPPSPQPHQNISRPHPHHSSSHNPSSKSLLPTRLSKPHFLPSPGYSPQRQRSLALQIKTIQRRKKQLLDQLHLVDKNLSSLLTEKNKYQKQTSSKSHERNPTNPEIKEVNQKAVNLVRKMNKERQMMNMRRNKTEERVQMGIQRREEKAEESRRIDSLQREQRRKEINDNIERRRASLFRNPVTPIRQRLPTEKLLHHSKQRNKPILNTEAFLNDCDKNDNSFLTELIDSVPSGNPPPHHSLHKPGLPKLETKKYPKTKIYKLITEESRMKRMAEELKEKNKVYNLEKRKLYNFVNGRGAGREGERERGFWSQKSYVYEIKEF